MIYSLLVDVQRCMQALYFTAFSVSLINLTLMKHLFTKYLLIAVLMAIAWLPSSAQLVLVRDVAASSGGTGQAGGITFDYTIGEPAIATIAAGSWMLSQGFQQPEVLPPLGPGLSPILDLILFPNPAATTARTQFSLLTETTITLMLVNTAGQVIYSERRVYGAGKVTIPTPVDKLAGGIYTVIIKAGGMVYTEKLIVQ